MFDQFTGLPVKANSETRGRHNFLPATRVVPTFTWSRNVLQTYSSNFSPKILPELWMIASAWLLHRHWINTRCFLGRHFHDFLCFAIILIQTHSFINNDIFFAAKKLICLHLSKNKCSLTWIANPEPKCVRGAASVFCFSSFAANRMISSPSSERQKSLSVFAEPTCFHSFKWDHMKHKRKQSSEWKVIDFMLEARSHVTRSSVLLTYTHITVIHSDQEMRKTYASFSKYKSFCKNGHQIQVVAWGVLIRTVGHPECKPNCLLSVVHQKAKLLEEKTVTKLHEGWDDNSDDSLVKKVFRIKRLLLKMCICVYVLLKEMRRSLNQK